jgi:hypothetical protein
MLELDEQLRRLIDSAAPPVRLEAIESRVRPALLEDRPAFGWVHLAAIACIATLVAGTSLAIFGSPSHHTRVTVAGSVPTTHLGALVPLPQAKLLTPQVTTDGPRPEDADEDEGPVDQSMVKITAAQAEAAATKPVPGTVQAVDLENEAGRTSYDVEIATSAGAVQDVEVNARRHGARAATGTRRRGPLTLTGALDDGDQDRREAHPAVWQSSNSENAESIWAPWNAGPWAPTATVRSRSRTDAGSAPREADIDRGGNCT